MKKIFILVITTLLSVNTINAQKSELMRLGIKAGINYANYTGSDVNTDAITNFHAGLVLEIKILKNFLRYDFRQVAQSRAKASL